MQIYIQVSTSFIESIDRILNRCPRCIKARQDRLRSSYNREDTDVRSIWTLVILRNNAPQSTTISFFFYLSIFRLDIVPRFDLDLVSSGGWKKKKKERIFQGFDSISRNNETFCNISPPRFSPPQRFFKVQRIWQKYLPVPIVPFLWFPHSYLPNERIQRGSRQFAVVLHRPTKRFHPFTSTRFIPDRRITRIFEISS